MNNTWWYQSGQAAEAARGLAWFVILVFVGIGIVLWHDYQKDKTAQRGDVRRGGRK